MNKQMILTCSSVYGGQKEISRAVVNVRVTPKRYVVQAKDVRENAGNIYFNRATGRRVPFNPHSSCAWKLEDLS